MPLKERQLRKLNREREESNQFIEVSNRSSEFETPVADPRRETSPLPALSAKITTENILGQL
jgi:hypothetical protein